MDEPFPEQTSPDGVGPTPVAPVSAAPVSTAPDAAAPPAPQFEGLPPGVTVVRRVRGPRRWPGILACVFAVLMLAATAAGIAVASSGSYTVSTGLAYLAIALSAIAIVLGLIAVIGRWPRRAGVVAVVVAVLGNPLVLLYGLSAIGGGA